MKLNKNRLLIAAALLFGAAFWLWQLWLRGFPDSQGFDFYPHWFASRLLLDGADPYTPESAQALRDSWNTYKIYRVPVVIPYPLPVIVSTLPLAVLPLPVASCAWLGLLVGAITLCCFYARSRGASPLLPLLFYPLFQTLEIEQAHLIWLGLAVLLIWLAARRRFRSAGLAAALLPGKPQAGLVLAAYAVLARLRQSPRLLLWSAVWALLLWGGSLLIMPAWPVKWFAVVRDYQKVLDGMGILEPLLPAGLLLLVASMRLNALALAAVLQVILFPVNDLYGTLPLLLAWIEIGGPLSLAGAGVSWLAHFIYSTPSNPQSIWLTVLFPYTIAAALRSFLLKRRR